MPLTKIQLFQQDILKGQAIPKDLLALLDAARQAGDGDDPLHEALSFSFLSPNRDYPLLSGSYLNETDRQNPDIMANVAAINQVMSMITFVAKSEDGDMIGYWHGPEQTSISEAPIVKLDTEGQFDLMQGRNLSEAMLGNYTFGDDARFADGRAWLAACGIEIEAANWHALATPVAATLPNKLHRSLYNDKRIAAGLKPIGR
jgi:hypothetical protein